MHPVSILTFGIFLAGYITARWDLVTRLYELAIFAWDHGVVVRQRLSLLHGPSPLTELGPDTCSERLWCTIHFLRARSNTYRAPCKQRSQLG